MAEVLSQGQIDALLSAARSGEVLAPQEEASAGKKYRRYDFKSPRKFTKDRLKMLDGVFENYARNMNSRFNGLMHTTCEMKVESAEEQRYYEFSNALTEGDVLTLAHLKYSGKTEDTPILLHVTTPLMLSMIDRLMGGEGNMDEDLSPDYSFTDLELKLYEGIMRDMVDNLGESWSSYFPLEFVFSRVEPNPTLMQPLGLDEIVVIMELVVKFPNCDGRISFCLPGMMLTNLFGEISRRNAAPENADEVSSQNIFETLRDTEIELVAELCRTQLKVSDVYHLSEGDIIDLHRPKDSPVYVTIGGRRWFTGKMGIHNKNIAVKIGSTCCDLRGRNVEQDGR